MFVISYDLDVAAANLHHPKGSRQAYADIEKSLRVHGFERAQWSVFVAREDNLEAFVRATIALKALEWFGACVKNVRAFRMEQGTDLTPIFVEPAQLTSPANP